MGLGPKRKAPRALVTPTDAVSLDQSKVLHQCTISLNRAAKKVVAFELRKVVKKKKDAATTTATTTTTTTKDSHLTASIDRLKSLDQSLLTNTLLRRLGLAHTGVNNCPLDGHCATLAANVSKSFKQFVEKLISTKTVSDAMDECNAKVTASRRKVIRRHEIDEGVAPPSKKQKKKDAERLKKEQTKNNWSKGGGYTGQQGVFLTLNGDAEQEDSGGEEAAPDPTNKYSQYGPGAADEYAQVTQAPKNRKGQQQRRAKRAAQEARKNGEKWDSNKNWRAVKKRDEEGNVVTEEMEIKLSHHDSGLRKDKKVKKEEVASGGQDWKEQGKAHPSWAAKKADTGIKEFSGTRVKFD